MKTALITESSRGIGRAVATRLAKDGYRVVVHCAANLQQPNKSEFEDLQKNPKQMCLTGR